MHKVILFRGGMCGDILLSMLNKKYVRDEKKWKNKKPLYAMKRYYDYSEKQKWAYFLDYNSVKGLNYTLSHDTNFCLRVKTNVIQLYCSDESLLKVFSHRFWTKNSYNDIKHVIKDFNFSEKNKTEEYAQNLKAWQDTIKFPYRFDIKNIFKNNFITDFQNVFNLDDLSWTKRVHKDFIKRET